MDKKFAAADDKMDQKFNEMDQRFNEMDQRFNEMDQRFNERFNEMDQSFNEKFNEMDQRFRGIEEQMAMMNTTLSHLTLFIGAQVPRPSAATASPSSPLVFASDASEDGTSLASAQSAAAWAGSGGVDVDDLVAHVEQTEAHLGTASSSAAALVKVRNIIYSV